MYIKYKHEIANESFLTYQNTKKFSEHRSQRIGLEFSPNL